MQIKYVVICYVEHQGKERYLRSEAEFLDEPTHEQIEKMLSRIELSDYVDYEIDYASGAILPEHAMPRKCKVKAIYAVVEKRFCREVEAN